MNRWMTLWTTLGCMWMALGLQAQEPGYQGVPAAPKDHAGAVKVLKQFEGEWDFGMKSSLPGKEAKSGQGTENARMAYGGQWLRCEDEGADAAGKPFSGQCIIGYDPHKKKYTGLWIDSESPKMRSFEGDVDSSGKVFMFKPSGRVSELGLGYPSANDAQQMSLPEVGSASYKDRVNALRAEQGASSRPDRLVIEFQDPDHHTLRIFGKSDPGSAKEEMWAEMTFVRRPSVK
jgi:hypothetical protein